MKKIGTQLFLFFSLNPVCVMLIFLLLLLSVNFGFSKSKNKELVNRESFGVESWIEERYHSNNWPFQHNIDGVHIFLPKGFSLNEEKIETVKGIIKDDFLVNDDTTGGSGQIYPSVSMDGIGRFIITWMDGRPGFDWDIYAQMYDSLGNPQGSNFRVNDDAGLDWQRFPSVSMNGSGRFVVVWEDYRNPGGDIYAQRYDSSGNPIGSNFRVTDDVGLDGQGNPSVSLGVTGSFVVTWDDIRNGDWDIYAQRYDSSGTPQDSNFKVNDDAGSTEQEYSSVSIESIGGFVVAWMDYRNDPENDIYAQRYDSLVCPSSSGLTPFSWPRICGNTMRDLCNLTDVT